MNEQNVLNPFWADFCCKVGVYYGFNSEISYQSWCRDRKKCQFSVLKELKVSKNESKSVKIEIYDGSNFFQKFKKGVRGQYRNGGDVSIFQVIKSNVPINQKYGKIFPIWLQICLLLYFDEFHVAKWYYYSIGQGGGGAKSLNIEYD